MKIFKYLIIISLFATANIFAECNQNDGCLNRYIYCSPNYELYSWNGTEYGNKVSLNNGLCPKCSHPPTTHSNDNDDLIIPNGGIYPGVKSPCTQSKKPSPVKPAKK